MAPNRSSAATHTNWPTIDPAPDLTSMWHTTDPAQPTWPTIEAAQHPSREAAQQLITISPTMDLAQRPAVGLTSMCPQSLHTFSALPITSLTSSICPTMDLARSPLSAPPISFPWLTSPLLEQMQYSAPSSVLEEPMTSLPTSWSGLSPWTIVDLIEPLSGKYSAD